jgi:hypothetical protein
MTSPRSAKRIKTTDTRVLNDDLSLTLIRFEKQLLESGSHSDITVDTVNKQYKLHRLFLTRSAYFNTLFTGNWSDNKNTIDLKHVEEEVIVPANVESSQTIWDNLFHYIYTDTLPDVEKLGLKEIEVLVRLTQFFGLNAYPLLQQIKDDFDRMFALYLSGLLPDESVTIQSYTSEVIDIVLSFCKINISDFKSKIPFVTQEFMRKIVTIPLIPLNLKVDIIDKWIGYNLKTKPSKDSKWRNKKEVTDYVQVVDSIRLYDLPQFSDSYLKNTNLFSANAIKSRMIWDNPLPDSFAPVTFQINDDEGESDYGPFSVAYECEADGDGNGFEVKLTTRNKLEQDSLKVTIFAKENNRWKGESKKINPQEDNESEFYPNFRDMPLFITIEKADSNGNESENDNENEDSE